MSFVLEANIRGGGKKLINCLISTENRIRKGWGRAEKRLPLSALPPPPYFSADS
jgi:hypothetical protein